jgi:Tol biopolymer transport system component/DNA-binding winged helix-turn-helix (wHTH) protein
VRLSGQPFLVLAKLLACAGDVVTREQLRAELWSETTFVDFEHGLNAAMNKLRRTLNDSAERPRYIETVPGRGYRFIGNLERPQAAAASIAPASESANTAIPRELPRKRSNLWRWLAATAACVAVALALRWFPGPADPPGAWKVTRLTADEGLSTDSALSRDGKLVAYSADSSLDGERDIYVRQVGGAGQPIRLTYDGAGNSTPDFSPDGTKIVFRSDRGGGGIYVIPAFGGEARLIARDGWNPRFSPEGTQVAYWVGTEHVAAAVPGSGTIWVIPAAGGEPKRVGPNFTSARFPIWSPDGKHLLSKGYTSARAFEYSSLDWWLVATDGGAAVKSGVYEALVRAKLRERDPGNDDGPEPACWPGATNAVTFSIDSGDVRNLWEINVSPRTGKVEGVPRRLTTGAGNEIDPSCASGGSLAFTNLETRRNVWSRPFDLDRATPEGALERITEGPALRDYPSLSNDGRYLASSSIESGLPNIWIREFGTGRESRVTESPFAQRYPVIAPSASRVAFSVFEKDKRTIYLAAPGGAPEKLCEGCLRATDWSDDEKRLLVFGGNPYQINVLDLASRRQTPVLKHRAYSLLYGRYSPDNRWVSFTARFSPNRARIEIAPVEGAKPVPESAWISIAEEGMEDSANWSPDGRTLYFTSRRDGHGCIWAQRLDAISHRPVGEAFAVQHLHGRVSYQQRGWSAAGGRIAMVLREDKGNIWMITRSGAGARE